MKNIIGPTKTLLMFKLKDNDSGEIINVCIPINEKQIIFDDNGNIKGFMQNSQDLNFKLLMKAIDELKSKIVSFDRVMLIDAYSHNYQSSTLN